MLEEVSETLPQVQYSEIRPVVWVPDSMGKVSHGDQHRSISSSKRPGLAGLAEAYSPVQSFSTGQYSIQDSTSQTVHESR